MLTEMNKTCGERQQHQKILKSKTIGTKQNKNVLKFYTQFIYVEISIKLRIKRFLFGWNRK